MKILPQSIRGRLLLAALVFTTAALLFASLSIGQVLDRFVRRGLNERLDAQIALLVRSVRPDGAIDRAMLEEIGPFTQHDRGWGWRIDSPGGTLNSQTIVPPEPPGPPDGPPAPERERRMRERRERPRSEGLPGHYMRSYTRATSGGPVTITVAAPRAVVDRMRRAAVAPLLWSLGALGAFLLAATLLQLRIGLRPLARLKASLGDVRAGRQARVPDDQPAELREVVAELNGLLDENEAALARARGHVANLAHSLKTPLATLNLRLGEAGRDPDGTLGDLVAQIDRGIRHHLGRARAASPGAPGQPQVPLASAVAGLVTALGRIHMERGIAAEVTIDPALTAKCDPQDLDEMLGNLLDNAWKWACARITVSAEAAGPQVRLTIDDDGPGLDAPAIEQALVPGLRLDERGDGHGFGLPIARELAELHGGGLTLGRSPLGGLRVVLVLAG
ncbi:sensor histidine kinase [Sphingomonas solaris]|uniref:histidine kinase n=1 Tax=Alterirhizorhabdus solaris TaxID=2529389 RepID=A0A558QWZ6_9SPHN|nr:HAMP domain-containing sensor histidine kinase [Sphingomonas solaris]TVV71660.1 HAMP domain-containing histidine kinase [Sphingomonas solaris]